MVCYDSCLENIKCGSYADFDFWIGFGCHPGINGSEASNPTKNCLMDGPVELTIISNHVPKNYWPLNASPYSLSKCHSKVNKRESQIK